MTDPESKSAPRGAFVGLGEVLWDLLPQGKQLGGAPANFAFHAAQLGHRGIVASRIGDDPLGHEIHERLASLGLSTEFLQRDRDHPTGTVKVEIDAAGQPRYTIVEGVAWDFLAWTPELERLAGETDAVCFGSLAQRNPESRATMRRFLAFCPASTLRIFDINLRQHFYDREVLTRGLELAAIAKMNDEELPCVARLLGLPEAGEETMARALLDRFNLRLVCVTRGAGGSLLLTASDVSSHPGFRVEVADTVGAGDAFIAAVAHHVLLGSSLAVANRAANRLGSYVATQWGATPSLPPEILAEVV